MINNQFEFNREDIDKMARDGYVLPESMDGTARAKKRITRRIQHTEALNWLLKAIDVCPLDKMQKMILRMRLWGKDPKVFCPLTCEQIALISKTRTESVEIIEAEAKATLKDYIERFNLADVIGKANEKITGGKGLTDIHGRPLTC